MHKGPRRSRASLSKGAVSATMMAPNMFPPQVSSSHGQIHAQYAMKREGPKGNNKKHPQHNPHEKEEKRQAVAASPADKTRPLCFNNVVLPFTLTYTIEMHGEGEGPRVAGRQTGLDGKVRNANKPSTA